MRADSKEAKKACLSILSVRTTGSEGVINISWPEKEGKRRTSET